MPQYPVKSVCPVIGFTQPGGGITQAEADARYLQLAGGTVTGNLAINGGIVNPSTVTGGNKGPGTINSSAIFVSDVAVP